VNLRARPRRRRAVFTADDPHGSFEYTSRQPLSASARAAATGAVDHRIGENPANVLAAFSTAQYAASAVHCSGVQ